MNVSISGSSINIRRSKGKHKVSSFFLIFGLCFVFFGSIFGFVGYLIIKGEQSYQSLGANTGGKLISKFVTTKRDSGKNTTSNSYNIRYNFVNERGDTVTGEDSLDRQRWDTLSEGQDITVTYIPKESENKNRMFFEGRSDNTAGYIFMAFSTLMSLLGFCFIVPYFRKRSLYKRLSQNGMTTEAEITSVGPGNITINNVRQWLIRYTYKDSRGQSHEGKSEHMSQREAEVWSRGDKARIRYDKNKPHLNIWLGEK